MVPAIVLAATSVAWLVVSRTMEGVVLVTVTPSHGFTGADLGGLAGLVVAGLVWSRSARSSK